MTDQPLAAVVLAAGQGKRMRARGPKVLVEACGRPLVAHVLEALRPLHARPTVVVHGHGGSAVQQALAGRDLLFAHQPEQRGTGHAVQCALPRLDGFAGDVLILCGDTPLLTTEVLQTLVAEHRRVGRALTVLSAELREPGSLGRILRDADGRLCEIREIADATPEEREVREINTGVMVIAIEHLARALQRLTRDNAQGEYYLTDVPGLLLRDGLAVGAYLTRDEGAALGVNDPHELADAIRLLRRRALEQAMERGVWVADPETTCIDAGAEIGAGTVLKPFTYIGPDVRVGRDCRVGPHAYLREGVVVGDGALLGSHVEVRGSTIEAEVSVPGPARLVGAAVGRGAYVGPGAMTAGEGEGRIVIGEHAHIGAGAVLVAPVTVAENERVEPRSLEGGGPSDA
ncbi:MAG: bifunctional UDP-N-acetylglucosamine diphosphorylase/glucosamine-1-phosphate N-acetyltransferase GlmU [Planctomycetota bacterium]|jgi:bifunctional UDP-N-acetylglucosamine pyrophosphorylase/glucosamine-1-phosphate N-acetyltransferase